MLSSVLMGLCIVLCGFVLSLGRFLNCLIVLENLNVLLLFCSLALLGDESRMFFLTLMVIFTVEVTLSLVVLTRIWDYSELVDVTSC